MLVKPYFYVMKIKYISLILALSVLSAVMALSILAETPAIKPAPDPEAKKHVLDNGMIVIVKEDHASPLAAVEVRVNVGSASEEEFSASGISHFVEHMLFKGTSKRRVGQIEKEIKSFGGTINGFTSHDYSGYTIAVPKKHVSGVLDILKDALFNSTIDPREMEKERNVILKEIKLNRDNPSKHISRLLWSTAYRSHPYRHPVIGHEDLFKALTREDLLRFYKRRYVPNNMVIALVGDFDAESVYLETKNAFGGIKRGSPVNTQIAEEARQISKRTLVKQDDIKLAYFGIGFRSVDIANKDLFALDVLAIILGQGASSRLNQSLYREKELAYSIGSWNYTPRDPGIFIISGVAEPENVPALLEGVNSQIDKIKNFTVEKKELMKAKNSVLANYISSKQTVSGQAGDLASSELLTGQYDFSKIYVEGIDSVAAEDIKRVASEYLKENFSTVVTLVPKAAATSYKKRDLSQPKYEIQKHELPNGLKVLLREDHRLPLVSIEALFGGGLRTEKADTNGVCNLTAAMLLKGTDSVSEADISNIVESLGGSIGYISGNNSFGIRLGLLSKDAHAGLGLMEEIIFHSTFPKKILEREKDSVLAAIKSEEDDIYKYAMNLFKQNLFENHPYGFRTIGSVDSVAGLKQKDVLGYHKSWCQPNNMVLAVFGDINPEETLAKIRTHFSGIRKGVVPTIPVKKGKGSGPEKEILRSLRKEQSVVMVGFPGTTIHNSDRYALAIISSILSGKDGRLSQQLREKLGLSYALGSFSLPGVDPGYYLFYVGTSPENSQTAKKQILNQIKHLIKKGVTDEELMLAKNGLIGNHKIAHEANSDLAFRTALDELYGLGYDDYLKYDKRIENITREDILKTARKYFGSSQRIIVVVEGDR